MHVLHGATGMWCGLHQVDISLSIRGFKFVPAEVKIKKWIFTMEQALSEEHLPPGASSKLGGKLSWGGSRLFRRLGRAMLRAIFDQRSKHDGWLSPELRRALRWWIAVLKLRLAELRKWRQEDEPPVHLFGDARGVPPNLGAVVFIGGSCLYTHMELPEHVMHQFLRRRDSQIMALELLAISLGLSTFESILWGRNVMIHSDSTGSEVRKCSSEVVASSSLSQSFVRQPCAEGRQDRTTMHNWCTPNGCRQPSAECSCTCCVCLPTTT